MDITVDGKPIKAIGVPSKQGWIYTFDRMTGQPVWPIVERPVEKGNVPGEWYSPTQPFPTKPAPFDRQGVSEADLIDWTPELKAEALRIAGLHKIGPIFTPPITPGEGGKAGTLMLPERHGRRELGRRRVRSRDRHRLHLLDDESHAPQPDQRSGAIEHELHPGRWRWRWWRRPRWWCEVAEGAAAGRRLPRCSACRRSCTGCSGCGAGARPASSADDGLRTAAHQAAVRTRHRNQHEHRRARLDAADRRHAGRHQESRAAEGRDDSAGPDAADAWASC